MLKLPSSVAIITTEVNYPMRYMRIGNKKKGRPRDNLTYNIMHYHNHVYHAGH